MVVGIKFPRRAESVSSYADYKVFVDFWNPLTELLTENYRRLVVRGETHILAVYGPQGAGKTLLGRQLQTDFTASQSGARTYSHENLWHRVAGLEANGVLPAQTTTDTTFRYFSSEDGWADEVAHEVGGAGGQRRCVAVADNAETYYFVAGLLQGMPAAGLAGLSEEQRLVAAAQQLVNAARTRMSRTLLVLLSNNMDFLQRLQTAVDAAHRGLMQIVEVPTPTALEKERAVRVNINRLNDVSYWYCLDSAGPDKKRAVYDSLRNTDATFPSAFEAVDTALVSAGTGTARTGRPAKKNLLSLVCLTNLEDASVGPGVGPSSTLEASSSLASSALYDRGWAPEIPTAREAGVVESEWALRLVLLARPSAAALLLSPSSADHQNACRALLMLLQQPLGGTSFVKTRQAYAKSISELSATWPDVTAASDQVAAFWSSNQARSIIYEPLLGTLLPSYNTGSSTASGFLGRRPDYVVADYTPCSLLSAASVNQIPRAIARTANVLEFTAQENVSVESLKTYLASRCRCT